MPFAVTLVTAAAACGEIREVPVGVGTTEEGDDGVDEDSNDIGDETTIGDTGTGSGTDTGGTTVCEDCDTESAPTGTTGGLVSDPLSFCIDVADAVAIPDAAGRPGHIELDIDVPETATVVDLDVGVRIVHPRLRELQIAVEHDGETVMLVEENMGLTCLGELLSVFFDDETGETVEAACQQAPDLDELMPLESLDVFEGVSPEGTWRLMVDDMEQDNAGGIDMFCVRIVVER